MLSHSRSLSTQTHGLRRSGDLHFPLDCVACGAHGTWHPGRQAVVCPACDTALDDAGNDGGPGAAFEFLPLLRDRQKSINQFLYPRLKTPSDLGKFSAPTRKLSTARCTNGVHRQRETYSKTSQHANLPVMRLRR